MDMDNQLIDIKHYEWSDIGRRFLPLFKPHGTKIIIAAILVGIVGLMVSLQPLLPKYVIDQAIPRKSVWLVLAAAGVYLLVSLIRVSFWYWAMKQVYSIQQHIVLDLRVLSFSHLQHLCLKFHSKFPSGFIYERVFGNSIHTLGTFMEVIFSQMVHYVVGLLFSLGFCLYLSPSLTLIILLLSSGYVITARRLSKSIYRKNRAANEAGMYIVNLIMDKLRGIKTIQAFALEQRTQAEFQRQLWPAMQKWMLGVLEATKLGLFTQGLSFFIAAVVVVVGAILVMYGEGRFPLGTMVAFIGYQGTLVTMISAITNSYGQMMNARLAFDQLFSILDMHSTIPEKIGVTMPDNLKTSLVFQNISFSYTDKTVLKNVNLTIPAGATVALVGRSGCGKSTLVNLMLRFYDPSEGTIYLDGYDIRDLPLRPYRAMFGVVLQDPFLFDATIEENLRTVHPEATTEEMREILKKAGAWEFVKDLPGQLQYRVGESGSSLSGGQRQRLALARCLLTHSAFIVLDEATSALDPESEQIVQQGVESISNGRTVVIIAHRLSTIRQADIIVAMDQGQVIEQGSYDELLSKNGLFAHLHAIATSTSTKRIKLEEAGFA